MCAYNQINDVYACQNNDTLGHLRNDMGFQGYIVSDWTATKSTEVSLKATMNQEMPYGLFYSDYMLQKKLDSGAITEQDIDDSVTSILYALYAAGIMDTPPSGNPTANVTSDAHNQLAREIAAKSTVLVKNSANLLPLNENNLKSCIAVFGDETTVAGGGSGHVEGPYVITPTQGIQNALTNANIQVLYSKGSDLAAAGALAAQCDVAVVVVATSSTEGLDRDSLDLPAAQNDLVTIVQQNNKNTIVAVNTPGAVLLPWAKDVSTILIDFFPGQEFGNALADVLFGKVNPSARLPVTIPNKENEVGFSKRQYPGVGFPPEAYYTEELLIGYRWYDANEVEPVFPFGHGLSYSTFQYSDLRQKTATVPKSSLLSSMKSFSNVNEYQVTITNTGSLEGDEVVQLYVEYPKLAREPPKQLRKFAKIHLKPAESKTVSFSLTERDVAIWNVESHAWEVVSGQYNVHVGASSRDIRQVAHFLVNSSA
jgi:beta-glucosidase